MIDTVLFDMGGTLEDIVSTPQNLRQAAQGITSILQGHGLTVTQGTDELREMLSLGHQRYSSLREVSGMELKPERIWADYMLVDSGIKKEEIEAVSEELACAWENLHFDRQSRPGIADMLEGLRQLGLKLGIISNTASLYQVFDQLNKYGIRDYFSDVTLSSQVGYRKPHPNIFDISLRQMRSEAQHSVYVGDTVSRDVLGAKHAGFAYTILINSQLTKEKDAPLYNAPQPDFVVDDITRVLQICQELMAEDSTD